MRLVQFRGKWCAYWREDGKPKRISLRTTDRVLAEQRLADLKKKPTGVTVTDIMESYLADRRQIVTAPQRLADAWKALGPLFGALRPDQVTVDTCRHYTAHRRSMGRKNNTIRKELSTLRTGLRWDDPHTPARFELPPSDPPRDRHLSRDEFHRLLRGADAHHVKLFILLALSTAGRMAAILDLTWNRVDFEKGIIRLSDGTQRRKGRATVPMTDAARKALLEASEGATTPYVIEWAGACVQNIKKGIKRAAERAGLDGVTAHVLRHTAAVWMAEAGVPMSEVAQYLGHSDSRITERVYARYSPEYLATAAMALEV
jgi:integrase